MKCYSVSITILNRTLDEQSCTLSVREKKYHASDFVHALLKLNWTDMGISFEKIHSHTIYSYILSDSIIS